MFGPIIPIDKVYGILKMRSQIHQNIYCWSLLFGLVFLFLTSCNDSNDIFRPDEVPNIGPEFKNIEVILEYFANSDTVKGHFIVNSGFDLGDLTIENPDNNVILDFFSDELKIHPNYLEFSTTQSSLKDFKRSYPKGEYKFSTWRGVNSMTKSSYNLSFEFSRPPEILHPPSKHFLAEKENLILKWKGSENTRSYIVRIFENGMLIYFSRLNSKEKEVQLPSSYFTNNNEYRVRLSSVNSFGNMATSSISFNKKKKSFIKSTN